MRLNEYLDVTQLREHIERGIVTERFHNTLPLAIYSYGKKAVYGQIWDDVTCKTRGLIVDRNTDEIIARPYEKFFDKEQSESILGMDVDDIDKEYGPPVITEKVNGCLGIFWKYGIHWGIATKGSFHSPHAEWATKWMEKHIEETGKLIFPEGFTPVFEIICQEVQPHVIKYDRDGLFLLNLINMVTGEELSYENTCNYAYKNKLQWATNGGSQSNRTSLNEALEMDSSDFEGLVATYHIPGEKPFKIKIKFPTFLKNRKLFYAEQKKEQDKSDEKYNEVFNQVSKRVLEASVRFTTRKEMAEFFNLPENKEYAAACFAILDEGDYRKIIWSMIK